MQIIHTYIYSYIYKCLISIYVIYTYIYSEALSEALRSPPPPGHTTLCTTYRIPFIKQSNCTSVSSALKHRQKLLTIPQMNECIIYETFCNTQILIKCSTPVCFDNALLVAHRSQPPGKIMNYKQTGKDDSDWKR